jgi:predicted house-cleaning NTP pyrophosphatase (Maf/HAM1 superfamily)
MFESQNAAQSIARFQNMQVGDCFIDHGGNVVEKIGETDVMIGNGYNGDISIANYIATVENADCYGNYLMPDDEALAWAADGRAFATA